MANYFSDGKMREIAGAIDFIEEYSNHKRNPEIEEKLRDIWNKSSELSRETPENLR